MKRINKDRQKYRPNKTNKQILIYIRYEYEAKFGPSDELYDV